MCRYYAFIVILITITAAGCGDYQVAAPDAAAPSPASDQRGASPAAHDPGVRYSSPQAAFEAYYEGFREFNWPKVYYTQSPRQRGCLGLRMARAQLQNREGFKQLKNGEAVPPMYQELMDIVQGHGVDAVALANLQSGFDSAQYDNGAITIPHENLPPFTAYVADPLGFFVDVMKYRERYDLIDKDKPTPPLVNVKINGDRAVGYMPSDLVISHHVVPFVQVNGSWFQD